MNGTSKRGMTLFVTLGFILSVLAVFAPVGATAGRAANFAVDLKIFNESAVDVTSTGADFATGMMLNITANVTIASGQPDATNTVVHVYINSVEIVNSTLGQINATTGTTYGVYVYGWSPAVYGDYNITVIAMNGTDDTTQTVVTNQHFLVRDSDMRIDTVTVAPVLAYINQTMVTVTAKVDNPGSNAGHANVTFKLDNSQLLGYNEVDVAATNTANAVLTTNFAGMTISDGNHTITASMMDLSASSNVSNNVTILNPVPDVQITGVDASSIAVTIEKGASLNVTITVHIINNGSADATNFPVNFYETDINTPKETVTVADILTPTTAMDVTWNWTITDSVTLGDHSIYVGVGSESAWPYWAFINITVNGLAKISISNFTALPASAFESDNITLTVKLFNNGTADAVNLTVEFFDGTVGIGTRTNVSVSKGQEITVPALIANVGNLTADTNKTYKAKVGSVEATAVVTAKDRVPKIEITAFSVEDGRIGDTVTFTATVKNNGTGDAIGLVVTFLDGTTSLNASAPFNLTVGSTKDVSLEGKLSGTPDANHTFFVQALGASKNVTKSIGHTLAPAKIYIVSMTVKPTKLEGKPKDSTQDYKITITLKNSGEVMGVCILNITEGKKLVTIIPVPVILNGGASVTQNYTWKVKGDGDHKAVATLSTGDVGTPATMEVKVTLKYSPGFEVLALVAAIIVAVILVRRRKN